VGLLLAEVELADLSVADSTEDGAVLLDALTLLGDTCALRVLLGVAGESLLLLGGTPAANEWSTNPPITCDCAQVMTHQFL
jgi:hypothetical protein